MDKKKRLHLTEKVKIKKIHITEENLLLFLLLAATAVPCMLIFGHSDLLVTAQRSLLYIYGTAETIWGSLWDNFAHFYSNSYYFAGEYGANYLPSTFLLFAVWNIPYKIVAMAPSVWGDWNVAFQLWNKLLPIVFYMGTTYLLYKICREELYLNQEESKWGALAFAMSPVAFFCQFIFCQYDIFTVFFMVWGLYYYFKLNRTRKDFIKFILLMGISATFKYFTLIILAVLLTLEIKEIWKLAAGFLAGCIPFAVECGFYLLTDRQSFLRSVFGFGALQYASGTGLSLGFVTLSALPLALAILLVIVYRTTILEGDHQRRVQYGIFYSTCACTALFGLMTWHPQWIIFAIPFFTLTMLLNKDKRFLLFLDGVFSVCYIGHAVKSYYMNVGQGLFKYGIFMERYCYRTEMPAGESMGQFFPIEDTTLFTILVAVMIAYCIMSRPGEKQESQIHRYRGALVGRYLFGILVYIIPAFLVLPRLQQQPELLWSSWYTDNTEVHITDFLTTGEPTTIQYVEGLEHTIDKVSVYTVCPDDNMKDLKVSLSIIDETDGEVIGYSLVTGLNIGNNAYTEFDFEDITVEAEHKYGFVFNCNEEKAVHLVYMLPPEDHRELHTDTLIKEHEGDTLKIGRKEYEGATLYMQIEGQYHDYKEDTEE